MQTPVQHHRSLAGGGGCWSLCPRPAPRLSCRPSPTPLSVDSAPHRSPVDGTHALWNPQRGCPPQPTFSRQQCSQDCSGSATT